MERARLQYYHYSTRLDTRTAHADSELTALTRIQETFDIATEGEILTSSLLVPYVGA